MPEYATDVDDGMFNYSDSGNCFFRPSLKLENTLSDDIIDFNKGNNIAEIVEVLNIG